MNGVLLDKKNIIDTLLFGKYLFKISHDNTLGWNGHKNDSLWDAVGAVIIQTNEGEFWVGGSGVVINFYLLIQHLKRVFFLLKKVCLKIITGKLYCT